MASNPFHHLYAGEKVDPSEFVEIFSHKLVEHASPVFQSGHVVLTGVQGSGKSMLYKLLDPAVRIAYADSNEPFPIPKENANFIGAGINVNTSRCNVFGNRRIAPGSSEKEVLFGDFFNYLVCSDIIRSVRLLGEHRQVSNDLSIDLSDKKTQALVDLVKMAPVWEGYLDGVESFDGLQSRMWARETAYRRFLNYNDRELDPEISSTKTSVGEPAKAVIRALRDTKIVSPETEFFILVDQYEELATINDQGDGADYRSVVNKCIGRDSTVSYRIGTRGYAWRNHLNVFGSKGHLEQDRDYKLVELDAKLRAQEFGGTSIYPNFANDVFLRRLKFLATPGSPRSNAKRISDALGHSLKPREEAKLLAGRNPSLALKIDADWPEAVGSHLEAIAETDPLSAKLGEVWFRQKGIPDGNLATPWEDQNRQYWRKERVELALLKIAGKRKQRAIYSGEGDILAISGGNILVFLSLCQYIWDYATQASSNRGKSPELPISHVVQTVSVFQTARTWLDRIPSDYGRSDDRYKLIQLLGEKFATALHGDDKMSNPGQNGISLSIEDLNQNADIMQFLIEAVDYGNLTMAEHATRNKDRKRRYKFYLNSLYCPIFRIPYQHTKEPQYIKAETLRDWLADAGILERLQPAVPRRRREKNTELPLLDLMNKQDG
ncbi:hypothetical protein [Roseovarius sp.]|uniref:ORC-CDC6 family AAA ATPase n=1 Tax=Roseovarius sp. TaxID=1486281 RepID=UPI003A97B462